MEVFASVHKFLQVFRGFGNQKGTKDTLLCSKKFGVLKVVP